MYALAVFTNGCTETDFTADVNCINPKSEIQYKIVEI